MRHTLRRNEILRGRKQFDQLFRRGERRSAAAIRCLILRDTTGAPPQLSAGFAVPKTAVPRAVDRNRLKRYLRESYRLHKHLLAPEQRTTGLTMLFLYARGKHSPEGLPSYHLVEQDMIALLQYIAGIAP